MFGLTKKYEIIGLLYCTCDVNMHHINLLLVTRGNDKNDKLHLCLIMDLSKLLSNKFSKCTRNRKHVCNMFLNWFCSQEKLNVYEQLCKNYRACVTIIPDFASREPIIKFSNYQALRIPPFTVYVDFECIIVEIPEKEDNFDTPSRVYQRRKPYSVAYYFVCSHNVDHILRHIRETIFISGYWISYAKNRWILKKL